MEKNIENFSLENSRLHWEVLSIKYIQEIFKELTDEVTKFLRVSTLKDIKQEEDRIRDSRKNI